MSESPDLPAVEATRRSRRRNRRRRVSVVGVLGELLITAGALVMLFLGWQLWWNDMIMADQQSQAAAKISQVWISDDHAAQDHTLPVPASADYGNPVVAAPPAEADPFAVLYVPRFGDDYHRTIAEGTGMDVLNSPRLGIGHYPGTQMPGEVGNFAIAAHRSANGGAMHLIHQLQLGDAIYVQTADGYYTYRFRDLEYVSPETVAVLDAVPHEPDLAPVDRLVTLTSCNPFYSTAERIIAYGVLESWQPIAAGPPTELAALIAVQAKG
ncbi:class E sortase [Cryobacterium sp. TMT1-21]|uniref:Class E sortase n=1 Tax=Cryobacterium shii TaxID=1259235 RepID=A0AAQ2C715_9MICO|nr:MULTISPECIES: class E sortase [Cryobacterium]TFC48943.1 class E sortase [Cryobacterium shii]TFC82938.1 class E sortase [Cryobacterium sp. TmT2-59]TFD12592.1 class E sortase [Cryobacterium sp. TMT1-21]TFD17224.1 class E sortase [Cryobacterium sp. TMT4-10]TFD25756.1 class E sortase [Cryobacterium sp. TMT2-23]